MQEHNDTTGTLEVTRIELYFRNGLDSTAFLTLWLTDGSKVTLELHPRFARLVWVLLDARKDDRGINAAGAEGWRSKGEIADAISRITKYRVDEATVTAYASQLLKRIRRKLKETADACPGARLNGDFRLLDRRRSLGVRVADGVEIDVVRPAVPKQNGAAEQHD